jgi:hypothetical protein
MFSANIYIADIDIYIITIIFVSLFCFGYSIFTVLMCF